MPAFRIRTATLADVPAMHAVRRAVRENALGDSGRITEASYSPFVDAGSIWVAEGPRGRILGFAAVDQGDASIWALFVDPSAEGAGVGRGLHDMTLVWARAAGLDHLRLTTAPGTRAERFYLRAGWVRAGTSSTGEAAFGRGLDD